MKIQPKYRDLLLMLKDNWVGLALACVFSAVVAGATAVMAYLVKPALDDVFIEKNRQMLILLPFLAVAAALAKSLAAYGHEYLLSYVEQDILRRLKNRLYRHMQELPLSFFQKKKTGDLMAKIWQVQE
jgi:subfamily B ATP-binding cassette protein MsbA